MKKNGSTSFRLLSPEQKITFFLIIFLGILMEFLFLFSSLSIKKSKKNYEAESFGKSVSTSLSLIVNQSVEVTKTLKNLYIDYPDLLKKDFEMISARVMEENSEIGGLYIAPDAIVQYAYPLEIQKGIIGLNLLEDPVQSEDTKLSIDRKRISVTGPYGLINGDVGFIIRNPIFIEGQFKAFSIVVLDWQKFVDKTISEIDVNQNDYYFGVWKSDNRNIVTDEYGFIFKDCDFDIPKDIDITINISDEVWHMSVYPVTGWPSVKDISLEIIISNIFILFLISMTYFHMIDTAMRMSSLKFDSLTGVLSRVSFYEEINKIKNTTPNAKYDIIVADIENFKVMNSVYGTVMCDKTLKYLAREYSKDNKFSTLARYGGDQFIVMFPSDSNEGKEHFLDFAKKISEKAPIANITIKYGYYGNIDLSLPANLICDRALIAARSILHNYEKIIANYEGPISSQVVKEQKLESAFQAALEKGEFKLWVQPKFDAHTEKVVGVEALVRWIKEDGTIIPPSEFIHVFEEDGLIVLLDEYIFCNVCERLQKMQKKGTKLYPISVNISRATLSHRDTIEKYANIVKDYGIPIEYVPLEITETTRTRDFEIKELTEQLKNAGFKIHMDDFGSGLSSLESLNILPYDVVKLDKSLIDYIGTSSGNELLRHCIELAHFKELKVVAEGVETKEQLDFLKTLNCDYIQGYYFSKPLSYEDSLLFFMKMYEENKI